MFVSRKVAAFSECVDVRLSENETQSCASCHLDHKGRGYDIMGWKSVPGGEKQFPRAFRLFGIK